MTRGIALLFLAAVVIACTAMENGPVLNPKTGPGTPYPCARPDGVYCGKGAGCCAAGTHCAGTDRCDANEPWNTDWLGARKSVPREPEKR